MHALRDVSENLVLEWKHLKRYSNPPSHLHSLGLLIKMHGQVLRVLGIGDPNHNEIDTTHLRE